MKIEHVALQVANPVAMADWYVAHLGLGIAWKGDSPPHGHFLADDGATVLLEIYHFDDVPLPDYQSQHPRVLHLAFQCDNVAAEMIRLKEAGASVESEAEVTPLGDTVAMLRDPWGLCLQLVQRAKPMLGSTP